MLKNKILPVAILIQFLIAGFAYGQSIKGTVGYSDEVSKISFDEIVKYDKLNPDTVMRAKKPKPKFVYPEFPIDESEIIYKHTEKWESSPASPSKDPSPLPDLEFMGLGDNGNSIPPDVHGAVGFDHLMITLNTQYRIQNKTGGVISTVGASSFWSGTPGSGGVFDPRVYFDPYEERWLVITTSGSSPQTSRLMVAASQTSDPTGNWNRYAIQATPNTSTWMDYPSVGFNKRWVVVSGNIFTSGGNFQNNIFFVIKKEDLYNGLPTAQYTELTYGPAFTITPAAVYDENLEDMYLIANIGGNASSGNIAKYKISGDIGSEIFTFQGYINTPNGWSNNSPGPGDFAPQMGSTHNINSGDARMMGVLYRNGKIWAAHHTFVPYNNPNRSVIQWWELEEDGTVLQFGRVDEANYHFSYPSIAVNGAEEIMIGYCSFSESQYASSSYSFRTADDPANTLRDRYQYKDGEAPYYKTYGGSRNRWGDYTKTSVDPSNDLNIWALSEYAESPANTWGTWWAMLMRATEPVTDFYASSTTLPVGSSVDFTDESLYTPTSWEWTFEGGTPSTSNEQHPQGIEYNTEGAFDVTLTTTNEVGSNTLTKEDYITVSTTILPEVEFEASSLEPCIGVDVEFTDNSLYNPNSWEWTITPSSFEFTNGTNENSQNPVIEFQQAGEYTVTLTATNNNGSNSLTKTDYILAGGINMPYAETFEYEMFSETNWTFENPDDDITWAFLSVDGNTPGSRAVFMDFYTYTVVGQRDNLISPAFNFTPYSTVELNFQHAYAQRFNDSHDTLNVYVSADCGATWEKVVGITEEDDNFVTHEYVSSQSFVPQTEDDWCGSGFGADCFSIDISAWAANQNSIKVMFESVTGIGNNLFIDNLEFDVLTGTKDINQDSDVIQIYPNPSNGIFTVMINNLKNETNIQVVDLTGHLVRNINISDAANNTGVSLDLKDFPKGIYFIRVINQNENHVEKIILK